MLKYHISGPWGRLAFDIECKNRWSHDLGNLLLASIGDNGNLQNCWYLECCFPVRSSFPEYIMLKIQMIFKTTCPLSIHIKLLPKYLNLCIVLPCAEGDPPMKMTPQICRIPAFGCYCRNKCSFFPVMFNIHRIIEYTILSIVKNVKRLYMWGKPGIPYTRDTNLLNLSLIRRQANDPVALHFCTNEHSVDDFTIIGLEKLYKDNMYHKNRENLWKKKLNTFYPYGINTKEI